MPSSDKYTRRLRVTGELSATNAVNYGFTPTIHGIKIKPKTANYTVLNADSGAYIFANNSSQIIYFTLPAVTECNGRFWNFFASNTGKFQIVGATNVIVDDYGATQKALNFGRGAEGEGCTLISDGVKFYATGLPRPEQVNAEFNYYSG